ncbi:hypothetical protein [Mycobacteroides franklinii]|uniref:hypothetical protein n=1 Tax=Mycobacteroides franklinii TaxID=948102 RepID=UPI000992F462|nr:hypothetical protein [Mycobacteroides franklinii]
MSNQLVRVERVAATDARFGWAKNVEFSIFGLENDFADAVDIAAGEMVHYRPWERSSEIYVGFSAESPEHPVGVLRSLRHDPELGLASFSTLRDARSYRDGTKDARNYLYPHWDSFFGGVAPERIAELATQGVRKKHRRAGMIEQIWREFFGGLAAEGVQFVTVALVVPLFDWYQHLLPDRLHQIGDILPNYIGADSVPAVVDISGSFVPGVADAVHNGSLLAASANPSSPKKERVR